jgi:NAD(P)-dependent dehydrogenase (short-subunit alcohol dehydrogenase family)
MAKSIQGWTKFSRFGDLDALSEEDWDKVRPLSNERSFLTVAVLGCQRQRADGAPPSRVAHLQRQPRRYHPSYSTTRLTSQGGSMIITSSVAGASTGGSSMAYSVTKAAQLHLMRCLAQSQGPKVRVNAVLPGLLLTDWVRAIIPCDGS